jgi:hypothetical protein
MENFRMEIYSLLRHEWPAELQLEVAKRLSDPGDCGALCLALPRIGIVAIRELEQYKDPLVSVAMRLLKQELVVDEALMCRYLWGGRVTIAGCEWLTATAHKEGSPLGIAVIRKVEDGNRNFSFRVGEQGAERLVRREKPNGRVFLFEGERDAERKVRLERPDGIVFLYEGERGAERLVRQKKPDGTVFLFEGEQGAERLVRTEKPNGTVFLYEGEREAERKVRQERPDGRVCLYEGERGAERKVRVYRTAGDA